MAKLKMKEATKELNQRSGVILAEAERIKRNADVMLQMLRQQETQFMRKEEDERVREKQQQQQEMLSQHTKAWTMPDDDVIADAKEEPKTEGPAQAVPVQAVPASAEAPAGKTTEVPDQPQTKVFPKAPAAEAPRPVSAYSPAQQRPFTSQPQGQRPAPAPRGQMPYGRPAYPQQQQGQQQRPFGRPAGQAPAMQGRAPVAGGAPGQQYGRPAFGRPAPRPGGQPFRSGDGPARPMNRGSSPAGHTRPATGEVPVTPQKERVSNYDPNKKNYARSSDPEHVTKNKRQQSRVKGTRVGFEDEFVRGRRVRPKKPSAQQMMAPIKIDKAYMTAETITVKGLTERIGKQSGEILKKLLLLGIVANINSELDYDTASLVCSEFGIELEMRMDKTAEDVLSAAFDQGEHDKDNVERPPVITIMGHVDHGKTSLLDYIRTAHVTDTEAGGITQHIGAYSVILDGKRITFLDTPGHEAFTAMRARGAQATDIAVLVVAADDGVMPQTVEAINHAKAAGVPIIIAINKMDKENANPERIKQDLTAYELVPEEWGGDTIMVPVSAKTGAGVDQLLEMIILQAGLLQLQANPNRLAKGIIIEAKLDKNRGPLATVLMQNGTLRVGDNVVAGHTSGRVRALNNDRGERVESAGPGIPVEIAGFTDVPDAGDEMYAVEDEKLTRQVAEERKEKARSERMQASNRVSLDNLFESISDGKIETLSIIIKADVQGSTEAVRQALEKLSSDKVRIKVLHSGVGAINKDDVNLATAFNAIIIGFNIRPDANARALAEKEEVDIRLYRVIYQAIEDIEKAMKGMLEPVFKENILGHAEVRNVFKVTGAGTIAGCYVLDGKLQRNESVRLLRDNVVIFEGKLSSLKRFKDDAREVSAGYECGVGLENYNDIKEKDVIECFTQEEVVD
ncbi:MAG: translation initiation factor IF-2 [Eubacteriales bacterium]|jgi:translation initiation factor IF-2|nr:translation initiation factor IF-2 [Eubacteriales bacterium]MDD4104716.1 translation initiation factor IF-2 [Eubacteriales bacterium]MDD4710296.1 translation initiation factor IF-2 [Eubacteriales bacterium]